MEGFGLAILEAMMFGIPVIATSVGAARDYILDGINGFIVPPKDSNSIAEKISLLKSNQELAERIRHNSYLTYINNFTG
ncbi:unnamed protein product, partial [marine sediment metagenome]